METDMEIMMNELVPRLIDEGEYERAVEFLNKGLAIDPDNSVGWFDLSYALSQLDRDEEALKACDTSLKLNPTCIDVWEERGYILYNLGRYAEALESLDTALALPNNPEDKSVVNGIIQLREEWQAELSSGKKGA